MAPISLLVVAMARFASGRKCRSIQRQIHSLQQSAIPWVAMQVPQQRIGLHIYEPDVRQRERSLQPLERAVQLAPACVHLGDLVGRISRIRADQLLERGLRLCCVTQIVLC